MASISNQRGTFPPAERVNYTRSTGSLCAITRRPASLHAGRDIEFEGYRNNGDCLSLIGKTPTSWTPEASCVSLYPPTYKWPPSPSVNHLKPHPQSPAMNSPPPSPPSNATQRYSAASPNQPVVYYSPSQCNAPRMRTIPLPAVDDAIRPWTTETTSPSPYGDCDEHLQRATRG